MISGNGDLSAFRYWILSLLSIYPFIPSLHVISEALLSPASKSKSESKDIGGVVSSSVQFTCKSVQKKLHSQAY